jgi:hypothetical protein
MRPKISVKPLASRNSKAPKLRPLSTWVLRYPGDIVTPDA